MDKYVLYKGKVMYTLYIYNSILAGPCPKEANKIMALMCKDKPGITGEGTFDDFIGANIDRKEDGKIHIT